MKEIGSWKALNDFRRERIEQAEEIRRSEEQRSQSLTAWVQHFTEFLEDIRINAPEITSVPASKISTTKSNRFHDNVRLIWGQRIITPEETEILEDFQKTVGKRTGLDRLHLRQFPKVIGPFDVGEITVSVGFEDLIGTVSVGGRVQKLNDYEANGIKPEILGQIDSALALPRRIYSYSRTSTGYRQVNGR